MLHRLSIRASLRLATAAALATSCLVTAGCRDVWDIQPFQQPDTTSGAGSTCAVRYDDSLIHDGDVEPLEDGGTSTTTTTITFTTSGGRDTGEGEPGAASCSSLEDVVFVYGSDSVPPILQQIGPKLAAQQTDRITIVYAEARSCAAIGAVHDGAPIQGTGCYYAADGKGDDSECGELGAKACALDGTLVPDIGVSDIYPETCNRPAAPDILHRTGPIQAAIFVTTARSSLEAISRRAAQAAYSPASTEIAPPWDDEQFVLRRIEESGTQRLTATFLGLDPDEPMRGASHSSSSKLIGAIEAWNGSLAGPAVDRVLGIYDVSNGDRRTKDGKVGWKALALSAEDGCAYLPDEIGYDKAHVRSGDYTLWSPLHFVSRAGGDNEKARRRVLDLVLLAPDVSVEGLARADVFATWVNRSFVPECAMAVRRQSENGPLTPVEATCTCAFERALKLATPGQCPLCDEAGAGCPDGYHCDFRFGHCELD